MHRKCVICGERAATSETVIINNESAEIDLCADCRAFMEAKGMTAAEFVRAYVRRKGKVCPVCGWTQEDFERTCLFGCPDCYREMSAIAADAVMSAQKSAFHRGKKPDVCGGV